MVKYPVGTQSNGCLTGAGAAWAGFEDGIAVDIEQAFIY